VLVRSTVDMQPSRTTDLVMELVATFPARPQVIALDGPSAAGTSADLVGRVVGIKDGLQPGIRRALPPVPR
jgi:hypothetical protein